ncbi:MAG: glycosyltransferase family 2 protein [Endomicrobiia bacterium]
MKKRFSPFVKFTCLGQGKLEGIFWDKGGFLKATILIPVYNEEKTLPEVLSKLEKLNIEKEIIIINDGSTDRTKEILEELVQKNRNIRVIHHEKNQGKGKAIQTGLRYSTGDIVVIQDADLEYDPFQIIELLKGFENPGIDAVFGSRFLKKNPNIYKRYLIGNKLLTFLINLFYGTNYTDSYTCYKLIKKDVFEKLNLESSRFEIEAEISIKLKKVGAKVIEFPIDYFPRRLEEGKKIGFKDALRGFFTIIKFILGGCMKGITLVSIVVGVISVLLAVILRIANTLGPFGIQATNLMFFAGICFLFAIALIEYKK